MSNAASSHSKRVAYNNQKSAEEVEVDALIQQLEVSPNGATDTLMPEAGTSEKGEPTKAEVQQQRSPAKHGKRHLIGKEAAPGVAKPSFNPKKEAAAMKNSRKPRNGAGRGLPKKGGAGGKGVWGKIGAELEDYDDALSHEPEDEPSDYDKAQAQKEEIVKPEQLRTVLTPVLAEYFTHGNTGEFIRSVDDRSIKPSITHMIAYNVIVMSMDKKASERELTSTLLADLYEQVLSEENYEAAFDQLLQDLPDLVLDCPDASNFVANFIARCVADDCLAPKFIDSRTEKLADKSSVAGKTLQQAAVSINMKHGLVRLDNVWGVSGGTRPVKHLIKRMHVILNEYVTSSGDVAEALKCLEELQVPHFKHEFVYEALVMVMEDSKDRAFELILKLLKEAAQETILTVDQLNMGFQRIYDDLEDIVLDVPSAYTTTEKFIAACHQDGVISEELAKKFPSRGRKRYVSENDGGRFKDDAAREEFRQRVASNPAPNEEEENGEK